MPVLNFARVSGKLRCSREMWAKQMAQDKGMAMKFVVCVSREGFGEFSADDLTLGRLYELISPADSHGMLKIIDDSGEDFLYPKFLFEAVELEQATASRLHAPLAA